MSGSTPNDATVVDLTANVDVTTALLLWPLKWRLRAVEAIEVESAEHCRRRRSLHCNPIRDLISDVAELGSADSAVVVMGVAPMPRGPLLDLDIVGPDGSTALLLPRSDIARRELSFLLALAVGAKVSVPDDALELLYAVLVFSAHAEFRERKRELVDRRWRERASRRVAMLRRRLWPDEEGEPPANRRRYVEDRLGIPVDDVTWKSWIRADHQCRTLLADYRTVDGFNIALEPLVALATLTFEGSPSSDVARLTRSIEAYTELVASMAFAASSPNAARDFLIALVDYGHAFDMLAEVTVPLDRAFVIKYAETRKIKLAWRPMTNVGTQDVVSADARTNHLYVQVNDPSVRLRKMGVRTPREQVGPDATGGFAVTEEAHVKSFYVHDYARDYRVRVHLDVAPLKRIALANLIAPAFMLATTYVLLRERPADKTLAAVAGPVALAASVLLTREPTTIGSRLRLTSTALVWLSLIILLGVASCLYFF